MKKRKNLYYIILTTVVVSIILGTTTFLKNNDSKKERIMKNTKNISTMNIKDISITVVYDNNPYKEGLETAWGFSCLIKGTEKTILFDTGGDGSILLANMKELNIDPKEIDIVVLSHIHGDHVGGLDNFLEKNPEVVVYLPASFPESFIDDVKEYGTDVVEVQEFLKICEGVYSTGELGTGIIEQSLIIKTEQGLIVITGCAHPGIVEIVKKAKELVEDDVLFVTGGFHLIKTSNKGRIVSGIRELDVLYVGPCHCSGDNARELFEKEYGENYVNVGVGRVITMDALK